MSSTTATFFLFSLFFSFSLLFLGFTLKADYDECQRLGFTSKADYDECQHMGRESETLKVTKCQRLGFTSKADYDERQRLGFTSKADYDKCQLVISRKGTKHYRWLLHSQLHEKVY